jgi:hypothetical protein
MRLWQLWVFIFLNDNCYSPFRTYEDISRSFQTGCLEWELQTVQLSATRCSYIAILWVSLVSFATITLCAAYQWVFVAVHFVIDSVQKLLDIPLSVIKTWPKFSRKPLSLFTDQSSICYISISSHTTSSYTLLQLITKQKTANLIQFPGLIKLCHQLTCSLEYQDFTLLEWEFYRFYIQVQGFSNFPLTLIRWFPYFQGWYPFPFEKKIIKTE